MCGRYTIAHSSDDILERFEAIIAEATGAVSAPTSTAGDNPPGVEVVAAGESGEKAASLTLRANYNVAPTTVVPIVYCPDSGDGEIGARTLITAKWGLLPFWVKDPKKAKPLINARCETIMESKTFKRPFMRHRCIIPADSFYEWEKSDGQKVPIRFLLKDHELFGFAGIWEEWRGPEGQNIISCTILTTTPNELVRPVHDRMPVILSKHMESLWLDTSKFDAQELAMAMVPYPADLMEKYAVSSLVNSVRNNSPACIEPALDNPYGLSGQNDQNIQNGKNREEQCQTQLQIPFN